MEFRFSLISNRIFCLYTEPPIPLPNLRPSPSNPSCESLPRRRKNDSLASLALRAHRPALPGLQCHSGADGQRQECARRRTGCRPHHARRSGQLCRSEHLAQSQISGRHGCVAIVGRLLRRIRVRRLQRVRRDSGGGRRRQRRHDGNATASAPPSYASDVSAASRELHTARHRAVSAHTDGTEFPAARRPHSARACGRVHVLRAGDRVRGLLRVQLGSDLRG